LEAAGKTNMTEVLGRNPHVKIEMTLDKRHFGRFDVKTSGIVKNRTG